MFNLSSEMILGNNLSYLDNLVLLVYFIIAYESFSLFVRDLFKTGELKLSSLNYLEGMFFKM
ncbi:MAG: hypothetical protein N2446_01645 [Elusimicrobiales bacterium]|nr:hypothetical protein [Elusimicrobiales bacterium]